MPIRLNLLAEQQAAEEARRRDPVKRACWAGGLAVVLMLLWSGNLQLRLSNLRNELAGYEGQWKQQEPKFLEVSNNFRELGNLQKRLDALQIFVTNRFLWSLPLNGLQYCADDKVRIVSLAGSINFAEQKQVTVPTNIFVSLPPKSWWWPWGNAYPDTNVVGAAQSLLKAITNRADLVRYQPHLISTWSVTTNPVQIVAKIEVVKPETVTEKASLTIRARDYSTPHGSKVDKFYQALTNAPFFNALLNRTNSSVQPESIQPRDDRTDIISPADLFIPFTIHCFFPERIRSNE